MPKPSARIIEADYQLMGLNPGVSAEELHAAYKGLVKKWHPDRFVNNAHEKHRAEEKLKEINAAYARLRGHALATSEQTGVTSSASHDLARPRAHATRQRRQSDRGMPPPRPRAFSSSEAAYRSLVSSSWVGSLRSRRVPMGISLLIVIFLAFWFSEGRWFRTADDGKLTPALEAPATPQPGLPGVTGMRGPASVSPQPPGRSAASKPAARSAISSADVGTTRPTGEPVVEKPFFTLGSFRHEVLRVQGKPQRVNGQTWIYGLSQVTFKEGRVRGYSDFDGSLRVKLVPTLPLSADARPLSFALGANRDEVLAVQGTPTRVDGNRWYYGMSEVTFKEGKVVAYNNFFHALKVVMPPQGVAARAVQPTYFTIGSTRDQVLSVQGTPTAIQANLWSYELSNVWFHEGKVRAVNDFSNVLKFRPAE